MKGRLCFKKILVFIGLLGLIYSCDKEDNALSEMTTEQDVSLIAFYGGSGLTSEPFLINDSTIHIVLPAGADVNEAKIKTNKRKAKLLIDSTQVVSGEGIADLSDFCNPPILVASEDDGIKERKLVVYDLPVLVINTPQSVEIDSKEVRTEGCTVHLFDTDGQSYDLGTAGIRGRGHSSWGQPKKPYNIKLDKKQSPLGMSKSKHWILLANAYYDRTQLHNATAFEMARLVGFDWVQEGRFVELILNGTHKGLYYLCEKVRAEKDKINIQQMDDVSGDITTGGYLLESHVVLVQNAETANYPENYFDTSVLNRTGDERYPCVLGWEVKEPDMSLNKVQLAMIKAQLAKVEELLLNGAEDGKYRELFDVDAAIKWWLVEEASQNEEASRSKNVYMYAESWGGQFKMGPPWDFDAWTFGLYGNHTLYSKDYALYYKYLFKDPFFVRQVKEKWISIYPVWKESIPDYIDKLYTIISRSAKRNEQLWPNWHQVNKYPETSYEQLVSEMKTSFTEQLAFMDEEIQQW